MRAKIVGGICYTISVLAFIAGIGLVGSNILTALEMLAAAFVAGLAGYYCDPFEDGESDE